LEVEFMSVVVLVVVLGFVVVLVFAFMSVVLVVFGAVASGFELTGLVESPYCVFICAPAEPAAATTSSAPQIASALFIGRPFPALWNWVRRPDAAHSGRRSSRKP
jgi:hypothetical protein